MINAICNAKTVVLYWDLPQNYHEGNVYKISLNNKTIAETKKCHIKIDNLTPSTEYEFSVDMSGETSCFIGSFICATNAQKEMIDITKPPYNAVGDGVTLNTEKIQAAIDACGKNQCVYIPAGDFMTGSLFLHSDMEVYLEKDADAGTQVDNQIKKDLIYASSAWEIGDTVTQLLTSAPFTDCKYTTVAYTKVSNDGVTWQDVLEMGCNTIPAVTDGTISVVKLED